MESKINAMMILNREYILKNFKFHKAVAQYY